MNEEASIRFADEFMKSQYGHRWDDDPYEHIDTWLSVKHRHYWMTGKQFTETEIREACETLSGADVNDEAENVRSFIALRDDPALRIRCG